MKKALFVLLALPLLFTSSAKAQTVTYDFCTSLTKLVKAAANNFSDVKGKFLEKDGDDYSYQTKVGFPKLENQEVVSDKSETWFSASTPFLNSSQDAVFELKDYAAIMQNCFGIKGELRNGSKGLPQFVFQKDQAEVRLSVMGSEGRYCNVLVISVAEEEGTEDETGAVQPTGDPLCTAISKLLSEASTGFKNLRGEVLDKTAEKISYVSSVQITGLQEPTIYVDKGRAHFSTSGKDYVNKKDAVNEYNAFAAALEKCLGLNGERDESDKKHYVISFEKGGHEFDVTMDYDDEEKTYYTSFTVWGK